MAVKRKRAYPRRGGKEAELVDVCGYLEGDDRFQLAPTPRIVAPPRFRPARNVHRGLAPGISADSDRACLACEMVARCREQLRLDRIVMCEAPDELDIASGACPPERAAPGDARRRC